MEESDELILSDLIMSSKIKHPNSHIAIYSCDTWRMDHRPLHLDVGCNFSFDWLLNKNIQDKFVLYMNNIIFADKYNKFNELFLNALITFNKALEQDKNGDITLAILLLLVTAESLITVNRNEKRLRLSALLPKLTNIEGYSNVDGSKIISDLYNKRNEFVHAGKEINISQDKLKKDDLDRINILKKYVANLLTNYLLYKNEIDEENGQKLITSWRKYLDNKFNSIIFGIRE